MRGHNNTTSGNIRVILFVLCAILMVLCLLILPWFCSSGEKSAKPLSEPIPTTLPDPIDSGNDNPVTIPISSTPDNSEASIKTYPTNPDYRNPEENQKPNDLDGEYPGKSVSAPSNPGYCTPDAPSISPTNWDDAGDPKTKYIRLIQRWIIPMMESMSLYIPEKTMIRRPTISNHPLLIMNNPMTT